MESDPEDDDLFILSMNIKPFFLLYICNSVQLQGMNGTDGQYRELSCTPCHITALTFSCPLPVVFLHDQRKKRKETLNINITQYICKPCLRKLNLLEAVG